MTILYTYILIGIIIFIWSERSVDWKEIYNHFHNQRLLKDLIVDEEDIRKGVQIIYYSQPLMWFFYIPLYFKHSK